MPLLRASVEAQLKDVRRRLEETEAAIDRSRTIVAQNDDRKQEIAAREAAGELSAKDAAAAMGEQRKLVERHVDEIDRLERVALLIRADIAKLEGDEQAEQYAAALAALHDADKAVVTVSTEIGQALHRIAGRSVKLESVRAARDELFRAALELRPEGANRPKRVDEPDWADEIERKQILELLAGGPLQPIADGQARKLEADARREAQDRELVHICVQGLAGLVTSADVEAEIARLPARLQPIAWEKARKLNADRLAQREERDRREAAQKAPRVLR